MRKITAGFDQRLQARVVSGRRLFYREGPDPDQDRPAHVRAGSGLCLLAGRIAVVQDDANFLALINPRTGEVNAVPLPRGDGGRRVFDDGLGNKRSKNDLEACVGAQTPDGEIFLALGSGSTPSREKVALAFWPFPPGGEMSVLPAPEFYRGLRERLEFSGSELNLEGAAVVPDGGLILFQRGNGAPVGDLKPVNATARVSLADLILHLQGQAEAPAPSDIVQYDLGRIQGVPLTFTDAAADGDGRIYFLAGAEDSPDAVQDGAVTGAALGVMGPGDAVRYTLILDRSGRCPPVKAEGLVFDPERPGRAWAAIDRDDPAEPTELWELELSGPWT